MTWRDGSDWLDRHEGHEGRNRWTWQTAQAWHTDVTDIQTDVTDGPPCCKSRFIIRHNLNFQQGGLNFLQGDLDFWQGSLNFCTGWSRFLANKFTKLSTNYSNCHFKSILIKHCVMILKHIKAKKQWYSICF